MLNVLLQQDLYKNDEGISRAWGFLYLSYANCFVIIYIYHGCSTHTLGWSSLVDKEVKWITKIGVNMKWQQLNTQNLITISLIQKLSHTLKSVSEHPKMIESWSQECHTQSSYSHGYGVHAWMDTSSHLEMRMVTSWLSQCLLLCLQIKG